MANRNMQRCSKLFVREMQIKPLSRTAHFTSVGQLSPWPSSSPASSWWPGLGCGFSGACFLCSTLSASAFGHSVPSSSFCTGSRLLTQLPDSNPSPHSSSLCCIAGRIAPGPTFLVSAPSLHVAYALSSHPCPLKTSKF